jgi:hypothetical protein
MVLDLIVAADCGLTDDDVIAMLDLSLHMHDLNGSFLVNN